MRWFWLFILGLCVLTGGLYAQRTSAERAAEQALQAQMEQERAESTPTRRPRRERDSTTPAEPAPSAPVITEPVVEQQPEQIVESTPEYESVDLDSETDETPSESTTQAFDPGSIMEKMQALKDQLPDTPHARDAKPSTEIQPARSTNTPEPTGEIVIDLPVQEESAPQEEPAGPSYELRADGSFKVLDANQWVQGAGTEAEPYVLGWEVLKSIDKHYDPKNGKDELPDWLDLLEGKFVTIEGNTLVPVVASTTRELLVMKNPWDGCCIGVPPTPYDAVEVALNHDVDFGNSAVGYGSVVGVFYADPYVVDGWVLGVYIIEDAKYRSGEGVIFPEF